MSDRYLSFPTGYDTGKFDRCPACGALWPKTEPVGFNRKRHTGSFIADGKQAPCRAEYNFPSAKSGATPEEARRAADEAWDALGFDVTQETPG